MAVPQISGGKQVGTCPDCGQDTYVNRSKSATVKMWVHKASGSVGCPPPPPVDSLADMPGLADRPPDKSWRYRVVGGALDKATVRSYGDTEFTAGGERYVLSPPQGRMKKWHFRLEET